MQKINFKLVNGELVQMQVNDEQYESFKGTQRPHWREEKQKHRHGLSLEQFIDENNFDIADDSQNPEILLDSSADKKQRSLLLKKLHQGLKMLSDKQSSTIHKHFFWGMSYEEIAREDGVSKQAIEQRIQSALKILKKLFSKTP